MLVARTLCSAVSSGLLLLLLTGARSGVSSASVAPRLDRLVAFATTTLERAGCCLQLGLMPTPELWINASCIPGPVVARPEQTNRESLSK